MKLNFVPTLVDTIFAAVAMSKRKVKSVELTREERAELYRSGDTRFVRCGPYARATRERELGVKGYRGYFSKIDVLVLAAEEQ